MYKPWLIISIGNLIDLNYTNNVRNVVEPEVYIMLEGFNIGIVKYSKMHIIVRMFNLDLVISSRVPHL